MKKRKFVLTVYLALFACWGYAQRMDTQEIFIATSEKEMYQLYAQMLDSARLSNYFLSPNPMIDRFGFSVFEEIESKDTIMKFVQLCRKNSREDYICKRGYSTYISNCMPVDFYERFLIYLKQMDKIENYYIKSHIYSPLHPVVRIVIKQYESGNLNKDDSIKARQLIEETLLTLINDNHNYRGLLRYDKYITDNIRRALVDVLENPFYPTKYLDFHISQQDTTCLDTVGIPPNIATLRRKAHFTPEELEVYKRDLPLYERLQRFLNYERMGKIEYNGLSAGQAYLQEKRDWFTAKGYLPINEIAKYAYQKQDELLIKHLKEFKKKHPDYPLEHF